MPVDPFSFDPPSSLPRRAMAYVARPFLYRLAGLHALRRTYAALAAGPDDTFAARVLEALAIDTQIEIADFSRIPHQGPLIIAANHPRGALDGLVLAALLTRVRPDVRLLANHLLACIPDLRSMCFFVDPFDGPKAAARSLSGLRSAHLWLRQGGALIMFPAGEVAHQRDAGGRPLEGPWSATLGRLASASGATVVPALLDGANSPLFYAAGRLHPRFRTLLLPRELLGARRTRVSVRIGPPIRGDAPGATTTRAQHAVTLLASLRSTPAAEIAALAPAASLIRSGRFEVFCAEARDIPATLHEIGRLRAVTFRAAGEGTSADIDLDEFDARYLHLFVWDHEQQRIIGAYRIGRTDRITREHGVAGLYSRTLFAYGQQLIDTITPALELGRSFVRVECQREHQPLLLLWRGIGRFVVRHPEYRFLFGPVSISGRYSQASHALLAAFLEGHHLDAPLARLVEPLHPRPAASAGDIAACDAGDVDRLVAGLEGDNKGMPVLLRQYLKLGARAVAFSMDPAFGHVMDALMVVDLTAVEIAILRRYLGEDGVETYMARHVGRRFSRAA